jgi:hypothetical protein
LLRAQEGDGLCDLQGLVSSTGMHGREKALIVKLVAHDPSQIGVGVCSLNSVKHVCRDLPLIAFFL